MQKPKFYNKDGSLTRYGLACGYIQRKENATHWKELYEDGHHFHVRYGTQGDGFTTWETYAWNELSQARKLYKSFKIN